MATFLIEGNAAIDRLEAASWDDAEAQLAGKGSVVGELVDCIHGKAAFALGEIKFAQDDGFMRFSGYGAVFNNVDLGGDKILPGAFSETLAQHKANGSMPSLLVEHGARAGGPPLPAGVWESMAEDGYGLRVTGKLSDTPLGRETHVLMKDGALKGLSIGYRVTELGRTSMQDTARRTIKAALLNEVSVVASPMNTAAKVLSVKTADDLKAEIKTLSELGRLLREATGWSRSQVEAVCSNFQAKASRGEPDEEAAQIAALLRRNLSILSK